MFYSPPNRIPTVDDEEPKATYQTWSKENTEIKTYAVDNTVYPGIRAETRDAARKHCTENFGEILEANYVPGRAFFRVRAK